MGADYDEVISLYDEVKFFPGVIGGHRVMPNIEILCEIDHSPLLKTIQVSNKRKIEREAGKRSGAAKKPNPLAATAKEMGC